MDYRAEYQRWLNSDKMKEEELSELMMMTGDDEKIQLAFSQPMTFGTAGLRAEMGVGIGRMNHFTVAQATQGIASLVLFEGGADSGVAIAYDSRNQSELFAKTAAAVLAANGIRVYIFDGIRPTPELSFAVRELSCMAGINITASHNPKQYNGYKAYWKDGAQISPEQAKIVSAAIAEIDVLDGAKEISFADGVNSGMITILGEAFDERYLAAVEATAINPDALHAVADELKIVYTPLHGAGYKLVPEIFRRSGMKHLYTVDAQMLPDGNFPTVVKPNPEYAEVFTLGIEIANRVGSDLVIASDPDADRIGVMCRKPDGGFATISGNQMGALLLDYIINAKREKGTLTPDDYAVKSIVSSDMATRIAEVQEVRLYDVLTGFKFIGEVIKNYEEAEKPGNFLLGFEESYGYLFGSYARDKDAVGAALMILEMTAFYQKKGMTLLNALEALYQAYGYYAEKTIDIYMEGLDGIAKRRALMENLRSAYPQAFCGYRTVKIGDFLTGEVRDLDNGDVTSTGLVLSDVLYYTLENGDKIIVRPSGTEPKVKIYILAHDTTREALEMKMAKYQEDALKEISI